MRVIGQTGARVTIERHGFDFWRGPMDAKGWLAPRQVSFLDDLRASRVVADLDRAALLTGKERTMGTTGTRTMALVGVGVTVIGYVVPVLGEVVVVQRDGKKSPAGRRGVGARAVRRKRLHSADHRRR